MEKGIVSWGFKKISSADSDVVKFEEIENINNKLTSYKIFEGVYVVFIDFKNKYQAKGPDSRDYNSYKISFCQEGNFYTDVKEKKALITTNEVYISKPLSLPRFFTTTSTNTLAFTIVILDSLLDENSFSYKVIRYFIDNANKVEDDSFIIDEENLVKEANKLIETLKSRDKTLIRLKTLELIHLISTIKVNKNRKLYYKLEAKEQIELIEEYMRNNLEKDMSLEFLSKKFKISKSKLNSSFVEFYQYTPMKYLKRLRIIEAQNQLITSYKTIVEIGNSLSFPNPSNFARAFKEFTGLSPSDYRKKNRNINVLS